MPWAYLERLPLVPFNAPLSYLTGLLQDTWLIAIRKIKYLPAEKESVSD